MIILEELQTHATHARHELFLGEWLESGITSFEQYPEYRTADGCPAYKGAFIFSRTSGSGMAHGGLKPNTQQKKVRRDGTSRESDFLVLRAL